MKFPVNSLLAGNFGAFRDGFARDSLLQERVHCELDHDVELAVDVEIARHEQIAKEIERASEPGVDTAPSQDETAALSSETPDRIRRWLPTRFP